MVFKIQLNIYTKNYAGLKKKARLSFNYRIPINRNEVIARIKEIQKEM